MSLKIVFAGTSEFAVPCLEALIESSHQIIAVYTQPDRPAGRGLKLTPSPIKVAALKHNLPVYQPASLKNLEDQQTLAALQPDLMVVVVYGLLLPKAVLLTPRLGCINIHPSLLPRWRGAAPLQRAIEAGDVETAVTTMQLDEGWDTGDILLQMPCPIGPEDTTGSLHDRLAVMSAELLVKTVAGLEAGSVHPTPQDHAQAIYAPKLEKTEGNLDWNLSAVALERKVRAFNPWPIAFTHWDGQPLRIWKSQVIEGGGEGLMPGTVISAQPEGIDVATGEGILRLLEVQMPGSKAVKVVDFVHGQGRGLMRGALLNNSTLLPNISPSPSGED